MHKSLLIGVVGVAVLLGGAYFITQTKGVQEQGLEGSAPGAETSEMAGVTEGSLAALAARSGSWKCVVDTTTATALSAGVVYVSEGKVRADFTTSVPSYGSVETHLIADGVDTYTWSSVMPQGIKAKMTTESGKTSAGTSGQGINASTIYRYDCEPWAADASLFSVPSSVTFREV